MRQKLMLVITFMLLPFTTNVFAQSESERVKEAIDILKGKSDANTAEWAVDVLNSISDSTVMSVAKNALAMAYLTGRVLSPDTVKAIKLLEEAVSMGNPYACHNLGVYYKTLPREKQDFKKAYHYFLEGAKNGKGICCYDVGYMLYKGLGCKQNYAEAIRYFQMDLQHSPSSMYMLGLCYRNGYGIEKDETKAFGLLRRASSVNYRSAIEEEQRDSAEVLERHSVSDDESSIIIPDVMPDVETFLDHSSDISGVYTGYLLTYDWSGNNIVKEQPLTISFLKNKDAYLGAFMLAGDTIPLSCSVPNNGDLRFHATSMQMYDRYIETKKSDYTVESASLTQLGNSLTGSLRLYSLTQREPERPMYVSLTKSSQDKFIDDRQCQIMAYPSEAGTIEVRFTLPNGVTSSSICLYNQLGIRQKFYDLGGLSSGAHIVMIRVPSDSGTYIVKMRADAYHCETLIRIN